MPSYCLAVALKKGIWKVAGLSHKDVGRMCRLFKCQGFC